MSTALVTYAEATTVEAELLTLVSRTKAKVATTSGAFCSDQSSEVWFPVAPDTTLPPPPASTTNPNPAPPNSVPLPPGTDLSDSCFIFQDLLPLSTAPVYAVELEPTVVLPPYIEEIPLLGITLAAMSVREHPYELTLPTETLALVTRAAISIPTYIANIDAGAFVFIGKAASVLYNRKLQGAVGSFALDGFGSGFVRDYVIGTNAGTFNVNGAGSGLAYQRLPLASEVGTFAIAGQDSGAFYGKTLISAVGSFAVTGEAAGSVRNYVMASGAGSFSTTGQAASLVYTAPGFKIITYTGNGTTTNAITGVGFQPAMVWTKRLTASDNHLIFSPAFENVFASNYYAFGWSSSGLSAGSTLSTMDSDGFTLKTTNNNVNGGSYIAYAWKSGASAATNNDGSIQTTVTVSSAIELSLFTFVGTGANATIGHGLSGTPDLVLLLDRTGSSAPRIGGPLIGDNLYLVSNLTNAAASGSTLFQSFGTTTVSIGSSAFVNRSSGNMLGIAFKSKAGASKISTFVGDGAATQAVTGLGFTPSWILVKSISGATSNYVVFTTGRDGRLFANSVTNEQTTDYITFDSDGFTLESGAGVNTSSVTYLYMAFA